MKAIQINKYGNNDVLEYNEVDKPSITSNQILIKVFASGVNPVDWKIREGYLKEMMPLSFPATLGVDVSGVIEDIGDSITEFKKGDSVYGLVSAGGNGSFAEYVAVEASQIALKPQSVSHQEAASLPLVGLSAWQALIDQAGLKADQHVLIHGGAGGIGTVAIQIAQSVGAVVACTASSEDAEYVKDLGADQVIDYKNEAFEDHMKQFDVVLDTIGGDTYEKSFVVLKEGGVIVSMVEMPNETLMKQYSVQAKIQFTQSNPQQLSELAKLTDSGKLKLHVSETLSLEDVAQAFDHLQNKHTKGKIVIKVV